MSELNQVLNSEVMEAAFNRENSKYRRDSQRVQKEIKNVKNAGLLLFQQVAKQQTKKKTKKISKLTNFFMKTVDGFSSQFDKAMLKISIKTISEAVWGEADTSAKIMAYKSDKEFVVIHESGRLIYKDKKSLKVKINKSKRQNSRFKKLQNSVFYLFRLY